MPEDSRWLPFHLLATAFAHPSGIIHHGLSQYLTLDQRSPRVGLIRGEVYFSDGSFLHFRELVELRASALRVMYSYHYQRADGTLVFRYDDTAHHPELATFPHHKHVGGESNVVAADAPDMAAVLAEIAALILLQRGSA